MAYTISTEDLVKKDYITQVRLASDLMSGEATIEGSTPSGDYVKLSDVYAALTDAFSTPSEYSVASQSGVQYTVGFSFALVTEGETVTGLDIRTGLTSTGKQAYLRNDPFWTPERLSIVGVTGFTTELRDFLEPEIEGDDFAKKPTCVRVLFNSPLDFSSITSDTVKGVNANLTTHTWACENDDNGYNIEDAHVAVLYPIN